ncbi:MAG: hypothetical protein HQL15_09870 [Candidatus Omnitrophica bacterium]|nr:hypothetical protein [Candidatus Omnitrophota bacterium]
MAKYVLNRRMLMTFAAMLVVTLSLSSCETLKKKFTRKKKANQMESAEFQPVLEPQDYPAPEHNSVEIYKSHYALIKVWYHDLWSGVSERGNDGGVSYAIKQTLDHIEQMKAMLKPEKAAGLTQLAGLLKFYQASLDQPRPVRNYSRIQSDLRAFDRMLRDQYRLDVIKRALNS